MKQYQKIIDGKPVVKTRNQIVVKETRMVVDKDGNEKEKTYAVYNPSEELLQRDGWEEYVREIDWLAETKKRLVKYDQSEAVNMFTVGGVPVWLDKATRAGLLLRFQAEQAQGIEDTTLWYKGMQFPLKVEQAIQMLYAIELYASACYDNTQRHLAALDMLEDEDSVKAYDYTTGYPRKLEF